MFHLQIQFNSNSQYKCPYSCFQHTKIDSSLCLTFYRKYHADLLIPHNWDVLLQTIILIEMIVNNQQNTLKY